MTMPAITPICIFTEPLTGPASITFVTTPSPLVTGGLVPVIGHLISPRPLAVSPKAMHMRLLVSESSYDAEDPENNNRANDYCLY